MSILSREFCALCNFIFIFVDDRPTNGVFVVDYGLFVPLLSVSLHLVYARETHLVPALKCSLINIIQTRIIKVFTTYG